MATSAEGAPEGFSPEELEEIYDIIEERLSIDCDADPDPLIDLPQVADLGGLAKVTPVQMRQRTAAGRSRHPFPEPAPGVGSRFADKPMWHAVSQIVPFLKATGHWPPGAGARPTTRGPRKRADAA
jgi:hypothetical protein